MLLLFFAIALTDTQQAQHDRIELGIYQRIQADQETISDIWRPDARVMADYKKARMSRNQRGISICKTKELEGKGVGI